MQDYDYTDYMRMMNMPTQQAPMMQMPQEQLESMFPRCYHIIMPEVENMCHRMFCMHGPMFNPNRQMLESMVDEIDRKVCDDVDMDYQDFDKCDDDRQFGFGGFGGGRRRFRRDLITILLLRSILRRRRPFFHLGF
jgi:hypothetical protein